MALDLSSLKKAVNSLNIAIKVVSSVNKKTIPKNQKDVLRAGVIQNFEFTYELCWKFMKRWLETNGEGASVDGATRKEIFRIAAEKQLIGDVAKWFEYTQARNETAHTYDNNTANEVFRKAKAFLKDAKKLLKELESKND
ncbi:MAG: nucleotidyltransferase [Elusimicrobia bacterium RIFOXYB12_FULL_50_12]|nr:MAG: nucleotidyltransferase [Elusimicrobia bacterium RIFOXYA12_FULL_49_49]OGS16582.1 MAG: nucleotidyltransferase [Elusimicrobia bacterium RIFOXYA2_FULL_47_53]OGS26750.1 MAG: nucleotidyltransferase [Elusimicrobia bacterium RIFOXYB12_FULL_50_12]OGS31558.1 MAG: nucleotidyltransferase [Elusimicrobia bacterium RIFOXYB2_FULL_46_23]